MGSSIAKTTSRVTSLSDSLPGGVSGESILSTAVRLAVFTSQKTAGEKKKEKSLNKETISAQASLETVSNGEKVATSDKTTSFEESGKDQSTHLLSSSESAVSNSSTTPKVLLDLTQLDGNLPVVVSASIAANYAAVLLDSLSVLPTSELKNFREHSPSFVGSGSVSSRNYYSSSTVIPVWTANMLGNAYGGGYVITPSIFVTNFPDSPSRSSGIPPGYELSSSKSENNIQSSRSSTRASVRSTGCVFSLVAGSASKEKEEATLLGVSTSSSVLEGFIVVIPTAANETETASPTTTKIPTSNTSNHGLLLKPVAAVTATKPSLASSNSMPVNETGRLNTSSLLLLHSMAITVNLASSPLIPPLMNQKTSSLLAANQSVIGAYSLTTSILDFQGLATGKTFDYFSLGLIPCIMTMSFILF